MDSSRVAAGLLLSAGSAGLRKRTADDTVSKTSTKNVTEVSSKVVTMEEVFNHKGENGVYWTVIDNEVYDISHFMPNHPGGEIIELAAGRDGTELVESYHPGTSQVKVKAAIKNKLTHIGHLKEKVPKMDDSFFKTVSKRVDNHLKSKGLNHHSGEMLGLLEAFVTLVMYLFLSVYLAKTGSYLVGAALGFFAGRMGFLMHMGNHAGMSSIPLFNHLVGGMMCLLGGSTFIWRREHQVAHHLSPNELGFDNDCKIGNPFLRFHPDLKHKWWHRFQTATTVLGMSVGQFKWYIADVLSHRRGNVGSVYFHVRLYDIIRLVIGKAQWFLLHVALPIYYQGVSWKWFGPFFLYMAVSAHYMQNVFIVNHIQQDLVPPKNLHWCNRQTRGTANWSSASVWWNFFSGGLNHQIEHHMFPSTHYYLYPQISPIVKKTCEEFNIPYHNYDSFPQAWIAMISYLHKLGHLPDF